MTPVAQALPTRFPCWVRAVYSWGGETKRDLGFVEGDLIECLNAGDGAWWMGRLKRDRRMVGLFPSNFVEVLDDSFQPGGYRAPSPLPPAQSTTNPATAKSPAAKQKSTFRKPFHAYYNAASPNPEAAEREKLARAGSTMSTNNGSFNSHRPYSSIKRPSDESRPASRMGPSSHSRAVSPAPEFNHQPVSPVASGVDLPYRNIPSPAPFPHNDGRSRAASPNPAAWADIGSPPPPAPPPHRYATSRAPSPQPYVNKDYDEGYHTPAPQSPNPNGHHTPSPLTTAMNDVMESLQSMDFSRRDDSPENGKETASVWSPEAFNEIYANARKAPRPHTVTGHQDSGYGGSFSEDYQKSRPPSQLDDYVERMENRLRQLHEQEGSQPGSYAYCNDTGQPPPHPPLKDVEYINRPKSAAGSIKDWSSKKLRKSLRQRKSAYELGKQSGLDRNATIKTTTTNSTNTTDRSLMSGLSAGAFSATSAGSFYRRKWALGGNNQRPMSVMDVRGESQSGVSFASRPHTPLTGGVSYHSSHDTGADRPDWVGSVNDAPSAMGGLTPASATKPKKSGFFKKMIDSAKTGAANARSTISTSSSRPSSPVKPQFFTNGISSIAGGTAVPSRPVSSAAKEMGLGGAIEWVQVRRDVNRSNTLSRNERDERAERCQLLDIPVIAPVEAVYEIAEGDEGLDGLPITDPTDFLSATNLGLVDKSSRFVRDLPATINAVSLAQQYLCRPYRSDVQRLRAIFTWVSERVTWEEDFESVDPSAIAVDTRRVVQTKRGCTQEIATLVAEMCAAVGIHAEVVRGYLKSPGERLECDNVAHPNHFWNALIIDGEWRIMDCSLASPTNPRRVLYSSCGGQQAEGWYFLTRPMQICWTHVPLLPEQQHIVPPVAHEVLMALPCACPPYFKNNVQISEFDTSMLHLENLEMTHLYFVVPEDVEIVAESEVRTFARDIDGDFFESGDIVRKPALSQAEWRGGLKRFTVKALLPGNEGQGVLKVYAGKRGLMVNHSFSGNSTINSELINSQHSIKSNPHSLAMALPITHTGQNPPYDFFTKHPTPHAQRHDIYVVQPQCLRLAANNTFVFHVRQHPSSLISSPNPNSGRPLSRAGSPNPYARPTSAMSMASVSATGSNYSNPSNSSGGSGGSAPSASSTASQRKPAKLAVQSPSGRIIRLTRKQDGTAARPVDLHDGTDWETIIKIGERGVWRGLVLADRSARWCVFAEWECF